MIIIQFLKRAHFFSVYIYRCIGISLYSKLMSRQHGHRYFATGKMHGHTTSSIILTNHETYKIAAEKFHQKFWWNIKSPEEIPETRQLRCIVLVNRWPTVRIFMAKKVYTINNNAYENNSLLFSASFCIPKMENSNHILYRNFYNWE